MKNVVIAGYARSPFTPVHKGALAGVRPDDLVAQVVKALVHKTGINPNDIEIKLEGDSLRKQQANLTTTNEIE